METLVGIMLGGILFILCIAPIGPIFFCFVGAVLESVKIDKAFMCSIDRMGEEVKRMKEVPKVENDMLKELEEKYNLREV